METKMKRTVAIVAGLAALPFLIAQTAEQQRAQQSGLNGMPDLVGGLNASEGCIGTKTARFSDGKSAIFAWFEDKEAALRWYNSDMHQGMMRGFTENDDQKFRKPMQHLDDHKGPIMVIASITFDPQNKVKGARMPISQIAIELYSPLPGGAYINDRVSPKELTIKGMADYSESIDSPKEEE